MYILYNEDDVAGTYARIVQVKAMLSTIPKNRPIDRMSYEHLLDDYYE